MKRHFNYPLFFLTTFLVCIGFLFLTCLSTTESLKVSANGNYYAVHQLFGLLVAIVLGFVAYKVSLDFVKKMALPVFLINLLLLFLVFIPGLGIRAGGASRWLDLGFFSFQPAELLKLTSILYLSAWIASKVDDSHATGWKFATKKSYYHIIVPFLTFLGLLLAVLYLQKDASTLGIITITLLVLYFSAKTPLWHTLFVVFCGIGSLLFMVIFEPYRLSRWLVFLNPNVDPLGSGFQLRQALISLGSGGVFGKGLGMSTQKFLLPEPMTDSIFAIMGEELGAIGCIALIGLFILFFWLGIKIAKNSNDRFAKMTAIGIVFWITFQAFVNISSAIGIFPLTGLPLPFFSYGSSHLAVELIGIGLLLNISKNT